jgi:hypothetical protein
MSWTLQSFQVVGALDQIPHGVYLVPQTCEVIRGSSREYHPELPILCLMEKHATIVTPSQIIQRVY